ncbi:hypothetical protein [Streptomyces clavuligerus]|uniref:Integral membrane protein n=1 Tax=Streptomyces clavuligerus TaxID=1901 RepID=B5GZA3_STRCL|nr:hypothetical protein [Streptomyces clavuligerus]ANW20416.1 hypothetical protein BB341_20480 [Streptomyces clavuligerus]AXU15041.1 hypothetical protein D1794_21315 [Streptomyces clavuligerus]EDY51649.1 conserved hypothetical protein [Streptomyces clavuligerus]EFG06621.1 Integral membrane protein [Streptomyces clavuligerus]MBY6305095.1 hypothetical protein [Streptomyces clavuligerus]
MNIRSLTRGDGVVIGAAVVLFIASFLDTWDIPCERDQICVGSPTGWDSGSLLLGVHLAGLVGAALIVLARMRPQGPKLLGIDAGQLGTALALFTAWSSLGAIFDPGGLQFEEIPAPDAGAGLILGFIAALALAVGAVCAQLVPALKAPLLGAPRPAAPAPYGQPQGGYGYPLPGQQSFGGQPGAGGQAAQPSFGGQQQAAGAAQEFAPFWFAVPVARPLYAEDGSSGPVAELTPGTWYLAVEQRGPGLVAQTQDGRRGVLQDTSGIQRG